MKNKGAVVILLILLLFLDSLSHGMDWCSYYFRTREFDRAIEECTEEIDGGKAGDGRLYEHYATRGLIHKIRGNLEQALSDFDSALSTGTDSRIKLSFTYNDRGSVYRQKGLYDRAVSDFRKAIELNPESYIGMYNLASVFSLMNDADSACAWLRKSIEKGFSVWKQALQREKALNNIRDTSCFREILSEG